MRPVLCGLGACVLAALGGVAARAEPRTVTWTSFLRAGPGLQYEATDELQGGGTVDVLGCAEGWCRVLAGGATGYLEADRVIAAPAANEAASPAKGTPAPACFDARQTGFHDPVLRFCSQLTGQN